MNPRLAEAQKRIFSADEWLKVCVYAEKPNLNSLRSALEDLRKAVSLVQAVETDACGQRGETKTVDDVEAMRERLNQK